jgi:hypothetical protein
MVVLVKLWQIFLRKKFFSRKPTFLAELFYAKHTGDLLYQLSNKNIQINLSGLTSLRVKLHNFKYHLGSLHH